MCIRSTVTVLLKREKINCVQPCVHKSYQENLECGGRFKPQDKKGYNVGLLST
jgi:hypothetical protein